MSGMIPIPVFIKEKEYTAAEWARHKRNRNKRRIVIIAIILISLLIYWIFGEINLIAILVVGGIAGVLLGLWQEPEK